MASGTTRPRACGGTARDAGPRARPRENLISLSVRDAAIGRRRGSLSPSAQPCDESAVRILVALVAQELDATQDGLLYLIA